MRRIGNSGLPSALALALLCAATAHAELEFHQSVDRQHVGTEDTFRLTIVLSDAPDGASLQFPSSRDFEVLSRSQSTQMSYSMGGRGSGMRRTQQYTIVMRANRVGKLTLPPATLTVGSKHYKTDAITIEVVKGRTQQPSRTTPKSMFPPGFPDPFQGFFDEDDPFGQGPSAPDPDVPRSEADIFIRSSLDKENVYVGEQVNLSIHIYSVMDLASVDGVSLPKLDGFLGEDLETPNQLAPEEKIINGTRYRVYLLRRRALFPIKAGSIDITPVEADITTGSLFRSRREHRVGNALTLKVKPLPKEATGLDVGQWRLKSELSATTTPVGTPVQARVSLDGRGNLKSAVMPRLTGPAGLKIYEPTTVDKSANQRGAVAGRRVQEYVVLPQQTGTFILPELTLKFFNPETGKVEEAKTDALTLTVTPGTGDSSSGANAGTAENKGAPKNRLASGGLRQLRSEATFKEHVEPLWSRAWFFPLASTPFALWLLLGLSSMIRKMFAPADGTNESRKKLKAAKIRLAQAQKLKANGKSSEFYSELEKAVLHFIEAQLGEPVTGLTRDQLDQKLVNAGVSERVRTAFKASLDLCDMGRFAPGMGDANARQKALDDVAQSMVAWETK